MTDLSDPFIMAIDNEDEIKRLKRDIENLNEVIAEMKKKLAEQESKLK